jgi:hypothetical protein
MNDELERIWNKTAVACLKLLCQHLSGVVQGNYRNSQAG